ncbi:MAG TPA: phage holin family protein, partial [Candidatus Elarobacter sp.]|nr:phage holin family protein [Candidatus Elarobacter sp.]
MDDETEILSGGDAPAGERGPISNLFRSITNVLATITALAHTRLELLTTEVQEEVHRVGEIMVWSLVAVLAAGIGLFLAALVVIFLFWDTHR